MKPNTLKTSLPDLVHQPDDPRLPANQQFQGLFRLFCILRITVKGWSKEPEPVLPVQRKLEVWLYCQGAHRRNKDIAFSDESTEAELPVMANGSVLGIACGDSGCT